MIRGLEIRGSGDDGAAIDAGVTLARTATGALVEGNRLVGNLHGISVHGAEDSLVRDNVIAAPVPHLHRQFEGLDLDGRGTASF